MKPARFEYAAPECVDDAVSLLHDAAGEAQLLAGGQSLMPLLNMRLARPELLVDLGRIRELDYLRETRDGLAIGAMTTKRAVERSPLTERLPMLRAATLLVGHPQIRNRGTVGGSLAQADPAAEYPALAVALGAELRVVGPAGERTVAAADFFVGTLATALGPSDILTEARFPTLPRGAGWSIQEFSRRHGDFALSGAAVTMRLGRRGVCKEVRIVLFGVGGTPVRVPEVEDMLHGQRPGDALFAEASQKLSERIEEPISDVHASSAYRRNLVRVVAERALAEAAARAGASA